MTGRPRSTRPGEPSADGARVRYRGSGRLGRVCQSAGEPRLGEVAVLFDGQVRPSSVPARKLEYLDGGGAPGNDKDPRP